MKLKDLFKSYIDMSHEEQARYIDKLQAQRIPLIKIEKLKKKKIELSPEEQVLIDKVMRGLRRGRILL